VNLRIAEKHRKFQDRRMMEAFPRATSSIGKWDYDDTTIIRPIICLVRSNCMLRSFPHILCQPHNEPGQGLPVYSISAESQSWHTAPTSPSELARWHTGCGLTMQSGCTESENVSPNALFLSALAIATGMNFS
jgi:hypothetical protein